MRKRKTTLEKIGFEFGVSGVAIRNWLKWIDSDYKKNLNQWRPVQVERQDRKSRQHVRRGKSHQRGDSRCDCRKAQRGEEHIAEQAPA